MMLWFLSAIAAVLATLLQYGFPPSAAGRGARSWALMLLRGAGMGLLAALLLDAPVGGSRAPTPAVALDVSASWRRGDEAGRAWRTALERVRALSADSVWLFGDSVRAGARDGGGLTSGPSDVGSRVAAVTERALAAGRPVVVITDGELDDPQSVTALPAGSRVDVVAGAAAPDLAVAGLDAPRGAVSGDSIVIRVELASGVAGSGPGRLTVALDGRVLAATAVDSTAPYTRRTVELRVRLPEGDGRRILGAFVSADRDAERRNDTLATVIEVARQAGVVVVTTAPDEDLRFALAVLRGTLALPVRAYLRLAPGLWRTEGTLAPVSEGEVRQAVRDAPVAMLHGDTAVFGVPLAAARGPLALVPAVGPGPDAGATGGRAEWFATAAPPSPLAPALNGIAWDSLSPLDVGAPAVGDWNALEVKRARQFEARAVITGASRPRRRVVVNATGMWRWAFRGERGPGADAFAGLWGSLFDWLAAERGDPRAAATADAVIRAGEPIRWRRGGARADSVVRLRLTRRGGSGASSSDTVTIRFPGGGAGSTGPADSGGEARSVAESRPLEPGIWDAEVRGGAVTLVVNASREWVPRPPTVRSGAVEGSGAAMAGAVPGLRSFGLAYAALALVLCADWAARRRVGLR